MYLMFTHLLHYIIFHDEISMFSKTGCVDSITQIIYFELITLLSTTSHKLFVNYLRNDLPMTGKGQNLGFGPTESDCA